MRKIGPIYWDVDSQVFRNSDGTEAPNNLSYRLYFRENVIVCVVFGHLVASTWTPIAIDAAGFSANIADDFDSSTGLLVSSADSSINQSGDWTPSGTADKSVGQLSIRLNGNTTNGQEQLGTAEYLSSRLEIQGFDENANMTFIQRFPFLYYNIQDQSGSVAPTFATSGFQSFAAGKWWFKFEDGWRYQVPQLQDTIPVMGWSDPVATLPT